VRLQPRTSSRARFAWRGPGTFSITWDDPDEPNVPVRSYAADLRCHDVDTCSSGPSVFPSGACSDRYDPVQMSRAAVSAEDGKGGIGNATDGKTDGPAMNRLSTSWQRRSGAYSGLGRRLIRVVPCDGKVPGRARRIALLEVRRPASAQSPALLANSRAMQLANSVSVRYSSRSLASRAGPWHSHASRLLSRTIRLLRSVPLRSIKSRIAPHREIVAAWPARGENQPCEIDTPTGHCEALIQRRKRKRPAATNA